MFHMHKQVSKQQHKFMQQAFILDCFKCRELSMGERERRIELATIKRRQSNSTKLKWKNATQHDTKAAACFRCVFPKIINQSILLCRFAAAEEERKFLPSRLHYAVIPITFMIDFLLKHGIEN